MSTPAESAVVRSLAALLRQIARRRASAAATDTPPRSPDPRRPAPPDLRPEGLPKAAGVVD